MKIEREQWRMVVALGLVAVIAALILGLADMVTREPIAEAQREMLHKALKQVLPEHANDPLQDILVIQPDGQQSVKVHLGYDTAGRINGMAWEVVAPDGYAGSIRILMGVEPDGRIYAIRVTNHHETPGLGDGIVNDSVWLDSFVDRQLDSTRWTVKKDGGDFDQFTGATITPRAVVHAVKRGLEFFRQHRKAIVGESGK
jgi:electron transport complex protein RnfG